MASIPRAKVFSVLDAKSGFLQIQLNYEISLLTTFNTSCGRCRWLRLPFGIKSASEVFQRIVDAMLEGIENTRAILDDVIIGAENEEHHDEILKQVVQRMTNWNLSVNFDKCQIKKAKVNYAGHIVTANRLEPGNGKICVVQEMPTPQSKGDVRCFL